MSDLNRREFVHFLAVLAAGAAALPEQIDTFEKYYSANAPMVDNLIAVDEIVMSGNALRSTPLLCNFYKNDHLIQPWGLNAFGGIIRWVAAPDAKIICGAADFFWDISLSSGEVFDQDDAPRFANVFRGQISFIDSQMKRQYLQIKEPRGSIA